MGKHGKDKGDEQTRIVFQPVVKEVGEGEAKAEFSLKHDQGTGRFDLRRSGSLLVSSVSLRDCVLAAGEHGVNYSDAEKKVTFKVVG